MDADVVVGALDADDAHHAEARERWTAWNAQDEQRLVSVVTLTEVLVRPARSASRLARAREAVAALGVTLHVPTEAVAVDAARLRGEHPISLADAFVLATARRARASVSTFDVRLLRAAEQEGLAP